MGCLVSTYTYLNFDIPINCTLKRIHVKSNKWRSNNEIMALFIGKYTGAGPSWNTWPFIFSCNVLTTNTTLQNYFDINMRFMDNKFTYMHYTEGSASTVYVTIIWDDNK